MSVPFSGSLRRSGGELSAVAKQLKLLNLKAARRVTVRLDPFREDVTHTRNFAHFLSAPRVGFTNPNCNIKTEIVCDRSEPTVEISLVPDIAEKAGFKNIVLKSGNLTCLELLQLLNKHVTTLAPVEEPVAIIQTKSEKKSVGKKRK